MSCCNRNAQETLRSPWDEFAVSISASTQARSIAGGLPPKNVKTSERLGCIYSIARPSPVAGYEDAAEPASPVTEPRTRALVVDGLPFTAISSTAPRRPDTPSFVLLHGIGTSHRYLARLHMELSVDADVHSIDLPGFGGVPKPNSNPDVHAVAGALSVVLEQLGVRRAVVIGHSMGAQWAVELAVIRPDLVSQVVLIGPVTDDKHRSLLAQAVALGRDTLGETPIVNAVVFTDYLRCGPSWFLKQSRFMINYPIEDRIQQLRMPVLIIRGGNDPIASTDWCRRLTRRAARGRLVVVPGHRHVVQHTAACAVASAIRDTIQNAPTQDRTVSAAGTRTESAPG